MIIETKTKKLTKNHPAVNALIRCSLFSHLNVLEYYIFVNSVMDLLMQADSEKYVHNFLFQAQIWRLGKGTVLEKMVLVHFFLEVFHLVMTMVTKYEIVFL